MSNRELLALLTWRMVSDPFPEQVELGVIDAMLNRESLARGYEDWIDAYHNLRALGR